MLERAAAPHGGRCALLMALALFALSLLGGCSALAPSGPTAFLGRYQRAGDGAPISDPDFLLSDYLEFRVGGQAVSLGYDDSTQTFYRTGLWRYRILDNGRIEATGRCGRGETQFDCTHSYNARFTGGLLTLSDRSDPAKRNEYRRLGDAPPQLPPLRSPTPAPRP